MGIKIQPGTQWQCHLCGAINTAGLPQCPRRDEHSAESKKFDLACRRQELDVELFKGGPAIFLQGPLSGKMAKLVERVLKEIGGAVTWEGLEDGRVAMYPGHKRRPS